MTSFSRIYESLSVEINFTDHLGHALRGNMVTRETIMATR